MFLEERVEPNMVLAVLQRQVIARWLFQSSVFGYHAILVRVVLDPDVDSSPGTHPGYDGWHSRAPCTHICTLIHT